MKLITQNDRIIALVTDDYVGLDTCMEIPEGLDLDRLSEYRLINEEWKIPIPQVVTARQAVQALILSGIDEEQVETAIAAMEDPIQQKLARNFWIRSNEFQRSNPYLINLAGALGLTNEQLDQLFISASTM